MRGELRQPVKSMNEFDALQQKLDTHFCREWPFIREPGLINRWKSGDASPARCKSDNLCFGPALEGKGVYCVVDATAKREV